MLKHLSIQNFALIDELEIDFTDGLSVITGETGAGKSILLGALRLILGARADHRSLKNQDKKCIVEASFKVSDYNLKAFFDNHDLDYWEETIIRREITAQAKSRSFINDSPTTLSVTKELGNQLIDIHSQHQSLQINDPAFQLMVIDSLSGNQDLKQEYQTAFLSYKKMASNLESLKEKAIESKKEEDFLQFQFEELTALNLSSAEDQALHQEQEQLANSESILSNFSQMESILSEQEGSVLEMIRQLKKLFGDNSNYLQSFKTLDERFQSVAIEMEDIAQSLNQEAEQYDFDPERQEYVEDRLGEIHRLQQKHQVDSVDELIELMESFDKQLQTISSYDEQIQKLEKEVQQRKKIAKDFAEKLRKKRLSVLKTLEDSLEKKLAHIGITHANFKAEHLACDNLEKDGIDRFRFLFSANKGVPPQQLAKTASGGELSRLMLAVKSLLANKEKMPTIIFDEIDTGVSGEVAAQMGTVLSRLADNMQVISITHLPQIAAKGTRHFFVYKTDESERAKTKIKQLQDNERLQELAKMLSGKKLSEAALNNARELLHQQ